MGGPTALFGSLVTKVATAVEHTANDVRQKYEHHQAESKENDRKQRLQATQADLAASEARIAQKASAQVASVEPSLAEQAKVAVANAHGMGANLDMQRAAQGRAANIERQMNGEEPSQPRVPSAG